MATISTVAPVASRDHQKSETSSKLIQMRLRKKTLDMLDDLHEMTGVENRTQIVASSIQLMHWISKVQEAGGKLVVEHKDGKREALRLLGL